MMKYIKPTLLVIIAIVTVSCGTYDKLLKSRDYLAMYDAALDYYEKGKDNKVITLLSTVEAVLDGTSKADTIKFYLAKTYYLQSDYVTSSEKLDEFRKQYTRSPFAEEAEFLYAMSYYKVAPNFELDQGPGRQAQAAFYEYKNRYPESKRMVELDAMLKELQDRFYQKSYYEAFTYYNIGAYNAAITSLKNAVKLNPSTPYKEEMMYLIVKSNYLFARKSVESKKRERYYNTIDAAYNFTSLYSESEYLDEVNRLLKNAKRLSKSDVLYGNDVELTETQMLNHNKLVEKLQDRVADGSMTQEEADQKEKEALTKAQERAKKRAELDATEVVSAVMKESTEQTKK